MEMGLTIRHDARPELIPNKCCGYLPVVYYMLDLEKDLERRNFERHCTILCPQCGRYVTRGSFIFACKKWNGENERNLINSFEYNYDYT